MTVVTREAIKLEEIKCPRCKSGKGSIVIKGKDFLHGIPGNFFVSECRECNLWFQNPRPQLKDLDKLYPDNYLPHVSVEKSSKAEPIIALRKRHLRENFKYTHFGTDRDVRGRSLRALLPGYHLLEKYKCNVELVPDYVTNGRLLEIGCGSGGRLVTLRKFGWTNLHGIELVPEAASKAREEGFSVESGLVEDAIENYPDAFFDVVISSMVLEHILDPFDLIYRITNKIKPGGQFLFSTIVKDSIDFKLYKRYWGGFDFPRHMVFFSKKDLSSLLRKQFQVEFVHQNAPQDFLRSAKWRIDNNEGQVYDRIILFLKDTKVLKTLVILLAWLGLTTRISFRCTKKNE